MIVLGVHHGHDSSASLMIDGELVASIAEERLSRVKNDTSFPYKSIFACLEIAGISSEEIDVVALPSLTHNYEFEAFFEIPPEIKIKRQSFKNLLKSKMFRKEIGSGDLPIYFQRYKLKSDCCVYYAGHHKSHAASAYFGSEVDRSTKSLVVSMDGRGEGISSAVWLASGLELNLLKSWPGSGSLGWAYGIATEAMGWRHGSDEWKVMGLAPYGERQLGLLDKFVPGYKAGELVRPVRGTKFKSWIERGGTHWHSDRAIEMSKSLNSVGMENYAAEIQGIIEDSAVELVVPWLENTKTKNLLCAGGAFLNIKLNQRLWETNLLDFHWIYPDAGDAGLSVGACYLASVDKFSEAKPVKSMYLGPKFSENQIEQILLSRGISYTKPKNLEVEVANLLAKNKAIGWFQGSMEAGPRALGNRSILMSPLRSENKDIINAKIKYREGFRPFCPSIKEENASLYLQNFRLEQYMTTSFQATRLAIEQTPAVVHKDNTMRPQMVSNKQNPLYHRLLSEFEKVTGHGVLMNTSFNVKGEPVVCSPRDAIKCFFDTGLDALVLDKFIVKKNVRPVH